MSLSECGLPRRLLSVLVVAAALLTLTCLASPGALAASHPQPARQKPAARQAPPPEPTPEQRLKQQAAELRAQAESRIGGFAAYADKKLGNLAHAGAMGWGVTVAAFLVGIVAMMYGWTLIQSLLIPLAPVWGVLTGGVTAFCIIEAFYMNSDKWFRIVMLTVGVALGLALYLFSALRARPVAAFLVVLSPFLIIAMPLFGLPGTQVVGLVLFCAGLLAGFAAMVEVRPLAIISTSLFGAACIIGVWGALAHLLAHRVAFLKVSFAWTIAQPLMLLLILGVLVFVGVSYQFTTGPRGTLAD